MEQFDLGLCIVSKFLDYAVEMRGCLTRKRRKQSHSLRNIEMLMRTATTLLIKSTLALN